jgi:CRP/FNR family transcriptional regulator
MAAPMNSRAGERRRGLLSHKATLELAAIASLESFAAGMVIHKSGERTDAVRNVVRGIVKIYVPNGASRRITGFVFPGDLLGFAEAPNAAAQAVTPVIAYRWDIEDLERLLRNDGDLQFCFLTKLSHELRCEHRYAASLAEMSAVQRLARFLLEVIGRNDGHGTPRSFELPMSRSEIASYVGLTLESVSRKFSALERAGVLKFHGRQRVEILDQPAFDRLLIAN